MLQNNSARYFPALTGVRGIASLWVFLFHAFAYRSIPLIERGDLGVDLFFVLSGFIICHIHAMDFKDGMLWVAFRRFMALRVARIYPLHLLTLLSLLAVVLLDPKFSAGHAPTEFSAFNFVGNLFLVHTWLTPIIPFEMRGPGWSWNAPAWSLSAEWLMYLLFPAISISLARVSRTIPLLALGLLSLAAYAALQLADVDLASLPRAGAEFFAGCTLYFALNQRHEQWRYWNIVAWLAIVILLFASIKKDLSLFAPVAFYILIPAIAFGTGRVSQFFGSRASVVLGEISLALYLIHWPILQVQKRLLPVNWYGAPIMLAAYLVFLTGIICTAFLVYRYFELPMLKRCRDWLIAGDRDLRRAV